MDPDKKRKVKRRRWLVAIVLVAVLFGLGQIVLDNFREEEKALRQHFRETVAETFPEQAASVYASFGLRPYGQKPLPQTTGERQRPDIVLIHGLDDPGRIWMNLAPALSPREFRVWIMTYPNDQPVNESARFFTTEMRALHTRGITKVIVVAHSMGGLVSRQMLTDPGIDYSGQVEAGRVPAVISLIMVGTPNNGSELARLRGFTELRDQLTRLAEGDGHWLGGILDGAGEAKLDLLPGSHFLETLNARPHPEGTAMLVIAGIATPWRDTEIETLADSLQEHAPESMHPIITDLQDILRSMTHGLGDGLVTVDSARLEGVPLVTVSGTHLSIIRNLSESSDRLPPAIPIIIDRIRRYSKNY